MILWEETCNLIWRAPRRTCLASQGARRWKFKSRTLTHVPLSWIKLLKATKEGGRVLMGVFCIFTVKLLRHTISRSVRLPAVMLTKPLPKSIWMRVCESRMFRLREFWRFFHILPHTINWLVKLPVDMITKPLPKSYCRRVCKPRIFRLREFWRVFHIHGEATTTQYQLTCKTTRRHANNASTKVLLNAGVPAPILTWIIIIGEF